MHAVERLEDRRLFTTYLGAAGQAASTTPLGINIGVQTSTSTDALFYDLSKDMDSWRANATNYPYLTSAQMTATGYPTLNGAYTATNMIGYPTGDYTLIYQQPAGGSATVVPSLMGSFDGSATTSTTGGVETTTVEVNVHDNPGDSRLLLTANNVSSTDPISNLHFYMPGYLNLVSQNAAIPELNPAVAARLGPFGTVRLMDLFQTNFSSVQTWAERTIPADFSYTTSAGIAYEDAVAIGNQLQENLWWNIPVGVSQSFVTNVAELIKYGSDGVNPYTGPMGSTVTSTNSNPIPASGAVYPGLNSNLKVYIEYGNELWHTGFNADGANVTAAFANPNIPGSSLANADPTWFGSANNGGEFAYAAEQEVYELQQAYTAFSGVYTSGLSSQVNFVLAGDNASSIFTQAAIVYLNDMAGQWGAPSSWISDYAVPTYVGLDGSFNASGLTTQAQVLNAIFSDLDGQITTSFASMVQSDAAFTSANGFTLVSYEGGQDLTSDGSSSLLVAAESVAQVDPRMGQLYTSLLNEWYALGGSLLLPYDFADASSGSNNYGLLQSASDAGSPKWDAVIQRLVPLGDTNLDGTADANDLAVLEANYGLSNNIYWQQGDLNGDGTVNAADFALLEQSNPSLDSAAQQFLSSNAQPQLLPENTVFGTSGSYEGGTTDTIANVFDGNLSSYFDASSSGNSLATGTSPASGNNYVGLDLASQYTITSVRFAPRVGFEARMVGGYFEASNDATFSTGDVVLYTITTAPLDGFTTEPVNSSVSGSYRYVMYVAPASAYGNVGEVQFYGTPPSAAGTPSITSATTSENQQTSSGLVISAANQTTTSYQISAIANGTLYLADGVTQVTDGQFITAAQGTAGLKFTPYSGISNPTGFSFSAQASSTGDVTGLSGGLATASITVNSAAAAITPTLTITDKGGAFTGSAYTATATVAGSNGNAGSSLESVTPLPLYYEIYTNGSIVSKTVSFSAPTEAGSYSTTAAFPGSTDYAAAVSSAKSFTITKVTPTVSVVTTSGGPPVSATVTGVNGTAAASLEGVTPTLLYYTNSAASGTGSSTPPSSGTYYAVASFAGSIDYNAASSSVTTVTGSSNQTTPTVAVTDASGVYNGNLYTATATVTGSSGTPGSSLENVTPTILYYTGSSVSGTGSSTAPKNAGTYTVQATFAGSTDYTSATSPAVTFTITQATPTLTVVDAGGTYSGSAYAATPTITGVQGKSDGSLGGVAVTLAYYTGSTATGTSTATAPTAVGTYTVVANFAGTTDYVAISSSAVTFNITKATPTVSVTDAGGTYTGSAFPATATVTGVSGTAASSLESVTPTFSYYTGSTASGTSTATAPSAKGTYTVVASFAGSTDYTAATSTATTFTISAASTGPTQLTPTTTTASTTSSYDGLSNDNYTAVFDGNTSTYWDSPNANGNYVQEGFSAPVTISSITYAPRPGFEYRMTGGTFEASNDSTFSSGVVTLFTVSGTPNDPLTTQAVTGVTGSYQYVRYVPAPNANTYGNISEMGVIGTLTTSGPAPVVSSGPTATVSAAGTSAALAVTATETGNPTLTYTWAFTSLPTGVTATPGLSSTNGKSTGTAVTASFLATGTYGLQVTITDTSGNSTVAQTSVTVGQVLNSITISPSGTTVSVPVSTTQTFTASGKDQFGVTMGTQPSFTWSLAANSTGSITTAGVYTSSATVGNTATVQVSATGSNGTVSASQAVKTTAASTGPTQLTPTTTTASTTSSYDGLSNDNYTAVFDGNTSTYWDSPNANGNYVQEGFSAPVTISSITYAPRPGFEYRMTGGTFEASNDSTFSSGVVTLFTVSGTPNDPLTTQAVTGVTGSYQYVRYVPAPNANTYGNISEMGVIGTLTTSGPAPVVSSGPTATVSAAGTSAALAVTATETGNPTLTYTWAFTSLPTGVTATPGLSSTNGKSTGTAVTASFLATGTYGLQVTITDTSGNSTVAQTSVTVGQVLNSITISPSGTTVSVPVSTTQTFTASGKDQFGVTMGTQPSFTWSLAANSTGSITTAGVYTSSATVGNTATVQVSATGSNGTVSASQAVKTTAASTGPTQLTPTTTTASTTSSYDGLSNDNYTAVFDGNTSTYWDSPNANGNYVQEGFSAPVTISSITYAPRPGFEYRMTGGTFEASNDSTFSSGVVTLFTVSGTPNDPLTTQAVTGVTGSYQYVRYVPAPNANTYGNISEMGVIGTLTTSGPAPVVSSGPTATVSAAGTSAALAVTATETGNPTLTYTWAFTSLPTGVTATPGLSSTNGKSTGTAVTASFLATGTYGLQVTITDTSGNSTVAQTSVTVGQVLNSITISPSGTTVSVPVSTTQTFTASGKDQFGVTMGTQPSFTWSLAANSTGSITTAGVYTSSATVGNTATVQVSATGSNGTVSASQAVKTTAASAAPGPLTPSSTTASNTSSYDGKSNDTYTAVFDGNTNTYWDSPNASGNWVQANLGAAHTITSIAFAPRPGFEYRMTGGYFEVSNDSTFSTGVTVIYTVSGTPSDGLTTVPITGLTGTYQYLRYVAPDNSYGNIAEMQIIGT